jgi:acetyltransferase-like isoleucine patch superfamily enzyme
MQPGRGGRRLQYRGEASLRGDGRIIIGDDVFIGVGRILDCTGELLIEEDAQVGPGVRILTHGPSLQFFVQVFDTSRNLPNLGLREAFFHTENS